MNFNENKEETKTPLIQKSLSLDPNLFEERYGHSMKNWKIEKWKQIYFQPITEGSLRASILCLLTITLGTSFLSIPYTMKLSGVILCLIIFFISACITYWTLSLLTETVLKEGSCNYKVLLEKYYGNNIIILTIIMSIINNLGSIVAWNVFISHILSNILNYFGVSDFFIDTMHTKFFTSLSLVLFIQVPVCTNDTIGKLHILSIAGCICILYVIGVSIFEFPYFFNKNYSPDRIVYFDFECNFMSIFCIFFFAFGNHSTIMNVLNELSDKTPIRVHKLVNYTNFSELILYLITMLVGYFSTYENTNEIYLDRDYQSIFMIIGKVLFILTLTCNICLYFYMIRPYLEYLFNFGKKEEKSLK
jgi:amino acid permease